MPHFTLAELAHGLNEVFVIVAYALSYADANWHCRIGRLPIDQRLKSTYKTYRGYLRRVGRFLRDPNDPLSALEEPSTVDCRVCINR